MRVNELRTKTGGELATLLRELRRKVVQVRFELQQGKVKNIAILRDVKKDIARILTVIHEKDLKG